MKECEKEKQYKQYQGPNVIKNIPGQLKIYFLINN